MLRLTYWYLGDTSVCMTSPKTSFFTLHCGHSCLCQAKRKN